MTEQIKNKMLFKPPSKKIELAEGNQNSLNTATFQIDKQICSIKQKFEDFNTKSELIEKGLETVEQSQKESNKVLQKALDYTVEGQKQIQTSLADGQKRTADILSHFETLKSKMSPEAIAKVELELQKAKELEEEIQKTLNKVSHNAEILDNQIYSNEQKMEDLKIKSLANEQDRKDLYNEALKDCEEANQKIQKLLDKDTENSNDDDDFISFLDEMYQELNDHLNEVKSQISEATEKGLDKEYIKHLNEMVEETQNEIITNRNMKQQCLQEAKDRKEQELLAECPCDEKKMV